MEAKARVTRAGGLTTRCKGLAGIVVGDCCPEGREPLIFVVRPLSASLTVHSLSFDKFYVRP